jgi:transcriptional regulator with XRE-family HTH domain
MKKPVKDGEKDSEMTEAEGSFQGMTIREIAELCGVRRRTVELWAGKEDFLSENFSLRNRILEKLEQGSPEKPSKYNLEETLAIIGEGGGNKTLASLLEENAVNKDTLAKGRYLTRHYAAHVKPAAEAADKVYALQNKYRDTDKVAKADVGVLFECASTLKRYYNETVIVNNELAIRNMALGQKLLRVCHRLGISSDDIPTYKSWDKNEWPDFPELSSPAPVPLLTDRGVK